MNSWRKAACLLALAAAPVTAGAPASAPLGPAAGAGEQNSFDSIPGFGRDIAAAAERALRTHPSIAAARKNVEASGHDISAARWLRFPSVSVQAVAGRNSLGGVLSPEIDVVQPLWSGGRIDGTIDRAKAAREVAAAELDEKALDLLIRLADSYYEIARTVRLKALYGESLAEHQKLVQSMERRVEQEVSPQTDLELARGRAAQVGQDLALVEGQHQAALSKFYELVGGRDFVLGAVPSYSPAEHHLVSDAAIRKAQSCHPTVRRLEAEVRVAEADRRLSKSAIFPQIGLQYSYDRFRGNQVGLALRGQTNGGLSPLAAAEAAASRKQASELGLADAKLEVGEEVSQDLILNRSAGARVGAGVSAAESMGNVTESYLRQFVAGRRTWLDVMNSVREAVAARGQLIEVETGAMASSARIHLRACEWN